jgi:1-acyl-sn-glycerol-3-phosphate acyltransferase
MLVMMSLPALYNYLYSMTVSGAYTLSPVFGGALFMSGAAASAYAQTYLGERRKSLTRRTRVLGTLLLTCMVLLALMLWVVYPFFARVSHFWEMSAVALVLNIRGVLGRGLIGGVLRGRISKTAFTVIFSLLQLLLTGLIALLFFLTLPLSAAWYMLGGYALSMLLEGYTQWRDRRSIAMEPKPEPLSKETAEHIAAELRQINAFGVYQRMHTLILIALQTTLIMVYTFIGITTREMISCLAISVACTISMREGTDFLLGRLKRRRPAILNLLIIGLGLWLYSLILFYRMLADGSSLVMTYITLGLCSAGLSISVTSLAQMEREMTAVAQYRLHDHMQGYGAMRAVNTELSILSGQLFALLLLAALCLPAGVDLKTLEFSQVVSNFRPLMILPPLLLTLGAFLAALRFPMNNRYFQKLKRFLTLTDEDNPALQKQLDTVVVHKHKNRFGLKIIIFFLRFLMPHKVLGKENLQGLEDGTVVLVCNHGEVYGPVAAALHVPISFRPWSISEMMDRGIIVDYLYKNTAVRQDWCPNFLKMPLTKMFARFFLWVFKSLDAIPVYRSNPHALIKTFRLTIDAMQAGDNLLIFPERGDNAKPGERGYAEGGIGDLYTGFAMLAPALYKRNRKIAVFVPTYASKKLKTLTFGKGVVFNPAASVNEEKLRIVNELQQTIEAMVADEQEALQKMIAKNPKEASDER